MGASGISAGTSKLFLIAIGVSLLLPIHETHAQQVSSSLHHTMIVCNDGTLLASGNNAIGEIGSNDYIPNEGLQNVVEGEWEMVSCGGEHTLLIKSDGTLWATGKGGRLGLGDYVNRDQPEQVGTDKNWVFVEAGDFTSFGIKADGSLWAWGVGLNGQLGLDAIAEALVPTQVGIGDKWVKISASQDFTLGLQNDGSIWGWGDNTNGQLGDGTSISSLIPVKVSAGNNWTDIVSGNSSFSLAIDTDGFLWGTGLNNFGQLGMGQELYSTLDWVKVHSDNKYIAIAAGHRHTLVLKEDHTLWSAGYNEYGQLGTGNYLQSFTFEQVGEADDWEIMDARLDHSLAIKSDGNLYAWGHNAEWQMPYCSDDGTLYRCKTPLLIGDPCSSNSTSINTQLTRNENVILYPMPVTNVLYFDRELCYTAYRITDLNGRYAMGSTNEICKSINLAHLQAGIYVIELFDGANVTRAKLVKQ